MNIQQIKVRDIIPYEQNPRKNEKAVEVVKKSIKEYGFLVPIILDKNNIIVAGHTRLLAAKQLEMEEVPVIYADNLTESQIKAFRIMENKSQEYATWDLKLLQLEVTELRTMGIDLSFTGIPESELNRLLKETNEQIKGNKEPKYKIKKGDLYKLGRHYLKCGDSTKPETYEFIDKSIDLIFTDHPYGVSYTGQIAYDISNPKKGSGKAWEMIQGDGLRGEELYNLLKNSFTEANKKLVKRGAVYCFYASRNHIIFEKALNDAGITVKQILIWNKHHVLGRSDYHWCHEPMIYGHKTGENCHYYGDRLEKTILNKPLTEEDLIKMPENEVRKILKSIIKHSDLWTIKKDNATDYIHPTQKPTALAKRAIINSSPREGAVLDLFAGSGSTLMACEELGRTNYSIEFDEKFCSHIIERFEENYGIKSEKIQ